LIPKGLLDEIRRWIKEGLYGHLQINFSGGKIMSVNRVQTCKVEMLIITTNVDSNGQLAGDANISLSGTGNP